ncbi:MAG: PH domain-containing protein [Clostridia bacterium]
MSDSDKKGSTTDIERKEPIFVLQPKFNFIYELFMPTGRKIKRTITAFLVFLLLMFFIMFIKKSVNIENIAASTLQNVYNIGSVVSIVVIVLCVLKLAFHIAFQYFQYKNIKYEFYDKHLLYIDNFLNQHKKNIQYINIKEVEIRRTIWDRILGFGIIVIYTNAENEYSNGLIVYAIKDADSYYEKIDALVHNIKESNNPQGSELGGNIEVQEKEEKMKNENYSKEVSFEDSLQKYKK